MTDKMKVYTKVLKMLKKQMPTLRQQFVVTLAMMISGIVTGKKAQLSVMSAQIPTRAKTKSTERRMRRFVNNKKIDKDVLYMPFAEIILQQLAQHTLYIAIDGSTVGRGCMMIMVGVVYHQRLLPLAWLTYQGKKGHTTAIRHIELLELLRPLIPTNGKVVLLGDAEYDTVEMLNWVRNETNWCFVMRSAPQILLTRAEETIKIRDLSPTQGSITARADCYFTAELFGPIMIIAWWGKKYKKPIYLITNHTEAKEACDYYKKRFKIETMFSDKKSRGFQIHKSHLSAPERVARLLLASCIAYLWMIYLGVSVKWDEKKRCLIDRTDRVDKSLFRLGIDWLNYALNHGLSFDVAFYLPFAHLNSSVR
jgi:hypothetical protein